MNFLSFERLRTESQPEVTQTVPTELENKIENLLHEYDHLVKTGGYPFAGENVTADFTVKNASYHVEIFKITGRKMGFSITKHVSKFGRSTAKNVYRASENVSGDFELMAELVKHWEEFKKASTVKIGDGNYYLGLDQQPQLINVPAQFRQAEKETNEPKNVAVEKTVLTAIVNTAIQPAVETDLSFAHEKSVQAARDVKTLLIEHNVTGTLLAGAPVSNMYDQNFSFLSPSGVLYQVEYVSHKMDGKFFSITVRKGDEASSENIAFLKDVYKREEIYFVWTPDVTIVNGNIFEELQQELLVMNGTQEPAVQSVATANPPYETTTPVAKKKKQTPLGFGIPFIAADIPENIAAILGPDTYEFGRQELLESMRPVAQEIAFTLWKQRGDKGVVINPNVELKLDYSDHQMSLLIKVKKNKKWEGALFSWNDEKHPEEPFRTRLLGNPHIIEPVLAQLPQLLQR